MSTQTPAAECTICGRDDIVQSDPDRCSRHVTEPEGRDMSTQEQPQPQHPETVNADLTSAYADMFRRLAIALRRDIRAGATIPGYDRDHEDMFQVEAWKTIEKIAAHNPGLLKTWAQDPNEPSWRALAAFDRD